MKNGSLTAAEINACNEFRKLLSESNQTQAEVAHAIGLSQDMVSKMSTGKRAITVDSAIAIAEHFRVPVYRLAPDIQARINLAYNSPSGGDIGEIIRLMSELGENGPALVKRILDTVIAAKVSHADNN